MGAGLALLAAAIAAWMSFAPSAPAQRRHLVRLVASVAPVERDVVSARHAGLPLRGHWVASWSASPQAPTPGTLSAIGFRDQTVRNIVFASAGGTKVRVLVTNAFGTRPLSVGRAAVGIRGQGAGAAAGHDEALAFRGRPSVMIAPGAAVLSDPVPLRVRPLQELVVSIFLPRFTGAATQHAIAEQVNYVAAGDHALDQGGAAFSAKTFSWYFVSSVDVLAPEDHTGAVVALGDSITDGVGSTVNANGRWPNELARRLRARPGTTLSVVDEGIGGNRLLNTSPCCGPSAVARLRRDVLRRAGVRDVIVLEGVNDINSSEHTGAATAPHANVSVEQLIAGYRKIIARTHAAHLRIFGATITPFRGARYWTPEGEAKRELVNQWILTGGAFDGVIDFARVLEDPGVPTMLAPAFDSGDHLHPNRAGYQAMANAIDLRMLVHGARGFGVLHQGFAVRRSGRRGRGVRRSAVPSSGVRGPIPRFAPGRAGQARISDLELATVRRTAR